MRTGKLAALSLVLLLGCARTHVHPREMGRVTSHNVREDGREAEMGRQIHQAIVSSFRIYTEPRLAGYVTRIGRSVARKAGRQDLTYRFTVLYDDRVYAMEAPGGFVYVTTGFLNFLQNEAELAAVLAHEIGELQFHDPRFSTAQQALKWATNTGAVVGPLLGQIGILAATGVVLLNAFTESRTPTPEKRVVLADRKALRYLVQAHQDPEGYLDFLGRLMNVAPEWSPYCYDYLSSRPVTVERYRRVLAEFEKLPLSGKSFTVNRERFLELTKGVREMYQK